MRLTHGRKMALRHVHFLFVTMTMFICASHAQDNADAWRFTGPNVAVGKATSQYPSMQTTLGADKAVDNNTNPVTGEGSCTHTDTPNPHTANWTVDLARNYVIKGIRIYNRDILQDRLQNFKIYGESPRILFYDDQAAVSPLYSQDVIPIPITGGFPVSKVIIEIPARSGDGAILTLCEVQIFVYTECSQPPDISDGVYLEPFKTYYLGGDTVTWTCKPGFAPRTNFTRTCSLQTAQWSSEDSTCKQNCILTSAFENGELNIIKGKNLTLAVDTGQSFSRGAVLEVICHDGYQTNVATMTCGTKGKWDNVAACDPVICQTLEDIGNGSYTYTLDGAVLSDKQFYIFKTVAVAKCNDGFEASDNAGDRVCSQNGSWTGMAATCVRRTLTSVTVPTQSTSVTVPQSESVTVPADVTTDPTVQTAMVGGALGGVIILLLAIILIVFIVRKRRNGAYGNKGSIRNDAYLGDSNANLTEASVYAEIQDVSDLPPENPEAPNDPDTVAYYSFTTPVKTPERGIKLEQLSDFVLSADFFHKKYTKEFKSFRDGLTKPHKVASKNRSKNKYRNVQPYDESRVVLEVWNSNRETDYINASYIHGFNKQKAYIASQGVINSNIDDFWRMVWQNNCGKIVMLTNIKEGEKVKCEQYWPSNGPTSYGSIQVTIKITETFSNFVIRHLSVRRKNEASRRVLHFHFTAWPDKDVPQYCTALVHFRAKVREEVANSEGPLLVHCSAGIGRTGTYIALDYLTDQGRALGVVDVPGCVEMLRRQRVNMVQTKAQYIFVHQALVETLMLSTSALPTADFPDKYRELLTIDKGKRIRKIDKEFEMLGSMPAMFEETQYAMVKKGQSRDKNRFHDIHPVMEFMPSLCGKGLGGMKDGYINAVFLPSYKDRHALIVTQTPLETTRHDFWRMVYHQEVNAIVMMNQRVEMEDTDVYWPETDQEFVFDDMKIINESPGKKLDSHRMLTLTLETVLEKRVIKLLQFGEWKKGNAVPSDPEYILTALKLIQDWQRHSSSTPIVVHCMNGAEKSGLFCMMYALLERSMIEHDVAIPQVIQEMRHRRQEIIPNVEQFVFCHEVVLMFLNQFETYANFAL